MYCMSMLSLFKLRQGKQKEGSYKTPFYPWSPFIALILSFICLVAIIWYNFILSLVFFAGLAVVVLLYKKFGRKEDEINEAITEDEMMPDAV
jgi:ethanolamine permease